MPQLHFGGFGATGQAQQLTAQTDTEYRNICFQHFADRSDCVIARLRVSRAIGQEYAVGIHGQHLAGRGLRWHDCHLAVTLCQHAQNIALHAVIEGHHVEGFFVLHFRITFATRTPLTLRPLVG